MLLAVLAGCGAHEIRHFEVLDRPDPVLVLPSTVPLFEPYVVGEAVTASGCEGMGEEQLSVQRLIEEARGEHDAIVQLTVERRINAACVGIGTRAAIARWQPTPFECLRGDSAEPGVRVHLANEQVCYTVSGLAADLEHEAPAVVAAPAAPAEVSLSPDPAATIVLAAGSPPFTSVEVRCPGGFRERADFVAGAARVRAVPEEACDLLFKGGAPARAQISGPRAVTCSFRGVAASCR